MYILSIYLSIYYFYLSIYLSIYLLHHHQAQEPVITVESRIRLGPSSVALAAKTDPYPSVPCCGLRTLKCCSQPGDAYCGEGQASFSYAQML